MRSNIKNYCNILPPLNWTPTIEELKKDQRMPPLSVVLFLKNLLKHTKNTVSAKKNEINWNIRIRFYSWSQEWWIIDPKTFPVRSWITWYYRSEKTCKKRQPFGETVWPMIMSWKLKPHKRESLTSFWIFLNIFLAPPSSNRRWQCIDHSERAILKRYFC